MYCSDCLQVASAACGMRLYRSVASWIRHSLIRGARLIPSGLCAHCSLARLMVVAISSALVWHGSSKWALREGGQSEANRAILVTSGVGRLGNQIYQYATLFSLAKKFNCIPYLNYAKHKALTEVFSGISIATYPKGFPDTAKDAIRLTDDDVYSGRMAALIKPGHVHRLQFVPKPIDLFLEYKTDLFKDLTFRRTLLNTREKYLLKVKSRMLEMEGKADDTDGITFVSLHVRRTDYEEFLHRLFGSKMLGKDFYIHALKTCIEELKLAPERTAVVLASDDPDWCKSNLVTAVGHSSNATDYAISLDPNQRLRAFFTSDHHPQLTKSSPEHFDFAVMSACNHSVFDYGTYAFWASWLAGGHVFMARASDGAREASDQVREIVRSGLHQKNFHFVN